MRARRVYGSSDCCVYHCVSRTVNGEMLFGLKEKSVFRKMLFQVADFSGVEMLTYAIMSNHLHVLVRVKADAKCIADAELVRRFKVLYPASTDFQSMTPAVFEDLLRTGEGEALRNQFTMRMGDVSEFMRTLKQRFSIWFNKSHNRFGPLWSDRFKSVILENDPAVLRTVSAYIDLNPVRAGLVENPKDYPFCGYREACDGRTSAQASVCLVTGCGNLAQALNDYQVLLMGKLGSGYQRTSKQTGIASSPVTFDKITSNEPHYAFLRQRLSFISEGIALGKSVFVNQLVEKWSPQIGDRRPRKPKETTGSEGWVTFRRVRS